MASVAVPLVMPKLTVYGNPVPQGSKHAFVVKGRTILREGFNEAAIRAAEAEREARGLAVVKMVVP